MVRIADFKEKHKDVLKNLSPEAEKEALTQHNIVNVLRDRDHKGRRILVVNSGGEYKGLFPICFSFLKILFFQHFGIRQK